jgi:hypothetical protein
VYGEGGGGMRKGPLLGLWGKGSNRKGENGESGNGKRGNGKGEM